MSTPVVSNFMRQQGFPDEPADACNMRFAGLYFQPRIVFSLVIVGIGLQSPWVFLLLSAVLWWNVLFPGVNPFERPYNRLIATLRRRVQGREGGGGDGRPAGARPASAPRDVEHLPRQGGPAVVGDRRRSGQVVPALHLHRRRGPAARADLAVAGPAGRRRWPNGRDDRRGPRADRRRDRRVGARRPAAQRVHVPAVREGLRGELRRGGGRGRGDGSGCVSALLADRKREGGHHRRGQQRLSRREGVTADLIRAPVVIGSTASC